MSEKKYNFLLTRPAGFLRCRRVSPVVAREVREVVREVVREDVREVVREKIQFSFDRVSRISAVPPGFLRGCHDLAHTPHFSR
jgi:hypothetical protein